MVQREALGRLLPVDMAFREWIRDLRLMAAISLPFFSTITACYSSSLQSDRGAGVRLGQNADLSLRRLLYLQRWYPERCSDVLRELSELLSTSLTNEQIEILVPEILETARSEGWIHHY